MEEGQKVQGEVALGNTRLGQHKNKVIGSEDGAPQ